MSRQKTNESSIGPNRPQGEIKHASFADFLAHPPDMASLRSATPERYRSERSAPGSSTSHLDFLTFGHDHAEEFPSFYYKPAPKQKLQKAPAPAEVFPNHKVIRMYRLNPDGSFIYSSSSEDEEPKKKPKPQKLPRLKKVFTFSEGKISSKNIDSDEENSRSQP